jgi:hypothetical protein
VRGQPALGKRPANEGRLSDLARTDHHLHMAALLGDSVTDELGLGADDLRHAYTLLRIVSKITQRPE